MAGPPEKAPPVRTPTKPAWATRRAKPPPSPLRAPRPPRRVVRPAEDLFVAPPPAQTWNAQAFAALERDLARFVALSPAAVRASVERLGVRIWMTSAGVAGGRPAHDAAWPFAGLPGLAGRSLSFDPARLLDREQFAELLRQYPFLAGLSLYPAMLPLRADAHPLAAILQRAVRPVLGGDPVAVAGVGGTLHEVLTAFAQLRERPIRESSTAIRDLDLVTRQAAELFVAETGWFLAQARAARATASRTNEELSGWQDLWVGVADNLQTWLTRTVGDVRHGAQLEGVVATLYYFARQHGFQRSAAILGRALVERGVAGEAAYLEPLALLAAIHDALLAGNVEAVSEAVWAYQDVERRLAERIDGGAEVVRSQLRRLLERRRQTPVEVGTLFRDGTAAIAAQGLSATVQAAEDYRAAHTLDQRLGLAAGRGELQPLPAVQFALADLELVLRHPRPLQLLESYVVLRERRAAATAASTPGTPAALPAGLSSGSDLFHRRFQQLLANLKEFVAPAKQAESRAVDIYMDAVRTGALALARSALGPLARLFEAHGDQLDGRIVTIAELLTLAGDDELLRGAVMTLQNLLKPILKPVAVA
ncbi:MAG: hypothetical protein HY696_02065 [Deltaproteobacteria bacterium]|nr:hypothetical protein [Deltaproteobacteria bacterium]